MTLYLSGHKSRTMWPAASTDNLFLEVGGCHTIDLSEYMETIGNHGHTKILSRKIGPNTRPKED